jgi:hypothetical protein
LAAKAGAFPLVRVGRAVPLVVSTDDHTGVVRVAGDLRDDIERVTGVRPRLVKDIVPSDREITCDDVRPVHRDATSTSPPPGTPSPRPECTASISGWSTRPSYSSAW